MELSEENNKIRVLWLCNLMPSFVGDAIGKPATNKEGWIAGMYCEVKNHNDITLAIAYPDREVYSGSTGDYFYYAFREDGNRPEDYESELKRGINDICESFKPDVIHCFGTEYAHTRALLENIDVLVDGEFILDKKDISLKFRGSSNQRVIDVPASLKAGKPVLLQGF